MFRRFLLLALVVLFASFPALASAQEAPYEVYGPAYRGALTVFRAPYYPGKSIVCSGRGFKANVEVYCCFDGATMAEVWTDNKGGAHYRFNIPNDTTQGVHSISMWGAKNKRGTLYLSKNITVKNPISKRYRGREYAVAKSFDQKPTGQANLLPILLATGIILTALGFGVKVLKK